MDWIDVGTIELSDQWQTTDLVGGAYFKLTHLSAPPGRQGLPPISKALLAQQDKDGVLYNIKTITWLDREEVITMDVPTYLVNVPEFFVEIDDLGESYRLAVKLLPTFAPWTLKISEAVGGYDQTGGDIETDVDLEQIFVAEL
jgi:hypothetical protein